MINANIRLFNKTATTFTTQGLGVLHPTRAEITEELNGLYEAELEIPITDLHYSELAMQSVIMVKPNPYEAAEPFRVYQISRPIGGLVTVNAAHLSYDLSKYADAPFTASSLAQIMTMLKSESVETCPFTFTTAKTATGEYEFKTPRSIRSLLAGSDDSILETFGGEWKFTGYTCRLYTERGQDRGFVIRYGKNMTDIRQEENCANVHSKLYPYWTDSEGNLVEVTGKTIDINTNGNGTLVYDMSSYFDTAPTPQELADAAAEYIVTANLAVPAVSLDVQFTQIDAVNNPIYLGDTVTVQFPRLGVNAKAKVVKTVYNALTDRYEELQIGDPRQTFAQTIAGLEVGSTTGVVGQSVIQAAVDKLAAIITGQVGGVIQLRDSNSDGMIDDQLVKDNKYLSQAEKIFKWGDNGGTLGLSYTTGGSGGTFSNVLRGLASGVWANFHRLYANESAGYIGQIVTAKNTATSIAAAAFVNICSISLPAGRWVINGQFRVYAGAAGLAMVGISTASATMQAAEGGFAQIPTTASTAQVALNVSRVLTLTKTTTVYLVGRQDTGATRNMTAGNSQITAICVG